MTRWNENEKITICTSCNIKLLGYYFCPQCGQEGTNVTMTLDMQAKLKQAIYKNPKNRKQT